MTTHTNFGKAVKKALIDLDKPAAWLVTQVREQTGMYFDAPYLSKLLTGKLQSPRLIQAICRILQLNEAG